jgi:hypothetical protein
LADLPASIRAVEPVHKHADSAIRAAPGWNLVTVRNKRWSALASK